MAQRFAIKGYRPCRRPPLSYWNPCEELHLLTMSPESPNVAYWRPKKTSLMPHLPLAETSFESPLAGSETAEQQQESCPTCLPSAAPRISNVAYWRPKKTSLMPHLPLAETSFESPLAGSETAEQQQDSCPTCLPSAAPRISNVAYWRPKKTSLMPHLPPCRNQLWESIGWFRNSQTAAGIVPNMPSQRSAPESLTLRTDALKKQVLCHTYPLQKPALRVHWLVPKQPNSSRNRAQHAFPAQRPESLTLRTDALKKQSFCHTYPLQKPALRVHWLVPKQPNSSRNRAQHAFPAQRPESLTLRTDALKKTSLMPHLPIAGTSFESPFWLGLMPHLPIAGTSFESPLAGSETAEQQQDSCPTCLPSAAPRISNVAYWRPKKTSLMPHLPLAETSFESPLAGSETAEQQQESCPTCLPSAAPRISNVAYWRPKKTKLLPHLPLAETSFESPLAGGSETAEQQQESCPTCLPSATPRISNVAYWRPKKNKSYATPTHCRNQLWEFILAGSYATPTHCRNQLWESIGWFRNSRTAAGFVPNMPSQRSAPNL